MKKISETIVFFGNERLATGVRTECLVLKTLIASGYNIPAVVINDQHVTSRTARQMEIASVAKAAGIPIIVTARLKDIVEELKGLQALASVLVAYGKIIPPEIIDIFPKGIVNLHPSLLPSHRGPTPIESTILAGDAYTGVSIMQLAPEMDSGPIFAQSKIKLKGDETKQELADTLLDLGATMFADLLPDILSGAVVALPQDDSLASYDALIKKEEGFIDWSKPAEKIAKEVRAYAGWPKSRGNISNKEVIVLEASAVSLSGAPGDTHPSKTELIIYCGKDSLKVDRLVPVGKKEMTGQAFLAGYTGLTQNRLFPS